MRRIAWILPVLAVFAAWAEQTVFWCADPYHRDVVVVTSDAPLGFLATRSQQVTGTVHLDPANVLAAPQAVFEVPVDSLSTGLLVRDEHLKSEGWLNARQFPLLRFTLKAVKSPPRPTPLVPGRPVDLDVVGSFELHGQAVDVPARVTVTLLPADDATALRLPGNLLRVDASFDVLLSDYGIVIPDAAAGMVANRQQVAVHLVAATQKLVVEK